MNEAPRCPKCEGELVRGFIPDFSYTASVVSVSSWYEGQPKKSFWTRTKAPFNGGIPIAAFRCKECGFLEFYSNNRFGAE